MATLNAAAPGRAPRSLDTPTAGHVTSAGDPAPGDTVDDNHHKVRGAHGSGRSRCGIRIVSRVACWIFRGVVLADFDGL